MGIQCAIVGLPNVGKSTLFNALTQAQIAAAANYPFCTIEPNIGVVPVPDTRLDQLALIVKPQKVLATTVEFVDIAGLVKGASKGEGLGNQFLANIRETNAIAHVVRCFENDDIIHVDGKINPLSDIETINTELLLADLETIEKAIFKLAKSAKSGEKIAVANHEMLLALKAHVETENFASTFVIAENYRQVVQNLHLLTIKPVMYIANVSEQGFTNNPLLEQVINYANKSNSPVIPVCAAMEAEFSELAESEKLEFLQEMGLSESGLNRVIKAGYALLGLHTYFTAGVKEVRAWTIQKNSKAPQAAAAIHTDFERGFIRAEIISFDDFITYNGEQGAKDAGKWRLEGKDYIVQDGDVIHFRFNV